MGGHRQSGKQSRKSEQAVVYTKTGKSWHAAGWEARESDTMSQCGCVWLQAADSPPKSACNYKDMVICYGIILLYSVKICHWNWYNKTLILQ